MSSIIYETINEFNKINNILPFRYIGSDQHNNPKYFGSNKELIKDIKKIGKEHFTKHIICEFKDNIDNVLLRKFESLIQKNINVAKNPEYYNKTNTSHKGYIETDDDKKIRLKKTHELHKKWWSGLNEKEKEDFRKKCSSGGENGMKGKTYEQIYGFENSILQKNKLKGEKNKMSKKVIDIKTGVIFNSMIDAMNFYGIKKYETLRNHCKQEKEMKFL